ncbi:hypothetical protein GXW74_19875 [Roseomonas eburnea]|uniref:Uncharacterized protein n=1 Tax=Neoroseomonas eburnea TaxID=1346889 RepID=A0A9X9XGC5_9PROT|nr:hypothetical protein [Neoroseomonas eburnea]MBR0682761.1 hypothetical protein [Neoroseomonas eburnea]
MSDIPHVTDHAIERARQRLGRTLRRDEWNALLLAVVERRALLLATRPGGKEIWLASVGEVPVRVVWAPDTAIIVTILPDTPAITAASAGMKARPVRKSFRNNLRYLRYLRGKRQRGSTIWAEGDGR